MTDPDFIGQGYGVQAEVRHTHSTVVSGAHGVAIGSTTLEFGQPGATVTLRHEDGTMLTGILTLEQLDQVADMFADVVFAMPQPASVQRH